MLKQEFLIKAGFFKAFRDLIPVPGIESRSLESEKIITGSLESEKSVPYRSTLGT